LVAGLPWYVELERHADQGQEVGVYTMCHLPFDWMTYRDASGFFFQFTLDVALDTTREVTFSSRRTWVETS
jgi:hypothetical protein